MMAQRWSSLAMCGARVSESMGICLVYFVFVLHAVMVECIVAFFETFCFVGGGCMRKRSLLHEIKHLGSSDQSVALS